MTVVGSNFIFIHVPKSAGQSVSKRLGGVSRGLPGHAPLFFIDANLRRGRFAFGFVRNPWDRMVSVYAFLCAKTVKRNESAEYQLNIREMGFKRWLLDDAFFQEQDSLWRTPGLEPIQRRSQMFWLEGCDFVGRVETLEADFSAIRSQLNQKPGWAERLGWKSVMPHRNRSRHAQYQTYYDDETREFIAGHFRPEIARFGYMFETEQPSDRQGD